MLYIKWIIAAMLAALLSGGIYLAEQKVESWGYAKAEEKYQKVIRKYETETDKRISDIIQQSNTLVLQSEIHTELLTKGVSDILKSTKGKVLTVIKNGECVPAPVFSDSFTDINKRVNAEMKK